MNKILRIFAGVLIVVLAGTAQAGQKHGFLSLPFGSTWEQAQAFAAKELGRYLVREDFDRMAISGYTLGPEQVVVYLAFDDNRRFYSLTIRMTAWSEGAGQTALVKKDADFLLSVFKKKYGPNYKIDRSRHSVILYSWDRPDLIIQIGMVGVDINDGIAAYGSVSDRRMAAAMKRRRDKEKEQKADNAAKGF